MVYNTQDYWGFGLFFIVSILYVTHHRQNRLGSTCATGMDPVYTLPLRN
jgi:hypothetical protein